MGDEEQVMKKSNTKESKKPVELTKKQELNNHIVLMRKVVRICRVHIINKLTKEIKKLKQRKGEEKALEKTKRKVERFLAEIQVIKHLREDKISIFALQDKSKLEDVLQNPKASTQDRALSRFSHHKLIQVEVLKYKTHNPYWDLQIPVLLERSKDKRRRINKKLAEREAQLAKGGKKEEKVVGDSSSEVEVGDEDKDSDDEKDDDSISVDEQVHDETLERIDNTELTKDKVKPTPKHSVKPIKKPSQVKKESKKQKKQLVKSSKVTNPKELFISKTEGTLKVQHLKDLADLENSCIDKPYINLTVNDLSIIPKPRSKSSFFVGGIDEVVEEPQEKRNNIDRNQRRKPSDFQKNKQNYQPTEIKPIFKKGKLVNKPSNSFKSHPPLGKTSRYFEKGGTGGGGNSNLTPLGNRSETEGRQNSKQAISTTPTQSEKLHPSWEAKKRQQPALAAFKGKKTKFEDD